MSIRGQLRNVGKVLLAILLGLWICWLLSGCSPKVVEVDRPVIIEQTHTATHTDIVRDTLVWRDSVYHYVQGDTVIIEKWHQVTQVNRFVVSDTVRDTIPRVVTVTQTQIREVNRLRWWQTALCWVGAVALLASGAWIVWKIK